MYIVDMHCDSLLTVSGEQGFVNNYNFSNKYPQLQFAAEFVPKRDGAPEARRARIKELCNAYLYECERLFLPRIMSGKDVFDAEARGGRSVLLSIEGGGGLFADSPELDVLYGAGLCVLGMAWDDNELSASAWTRNDYGLTEAGVALAKRCADMGIVLDVSHLSDKAFYDTLEVCPMPLLATHSNFREVTPSARNLTLDMAKKIVARGGVIGLNLYPDFLAESGADTDDILRHVDYALENLGENALGFGFDIDGTSGQYPRGITASHSIHEQVIDLLLSHYSYSVVERIAGLNVLDFLKNNLF